MTAPKKMDFNDEQQAIGIEAQAKKFAEFDRIDKPHSKAANDSKASAKAIISNECYRLYSDRLEAKIGSKDGDFKKVGNYINVVGKTNLDSISYLLLEFLDSNNTLVDFMLECGELVDSRGLCKKLLNAGYKMDLYYQKQLQTYLSEANPASNIIATKQIGWQYGAYVLPHRVIGGKGDIRYYGNLDIERFKPSGTLEQWQEHVAKHCIGFDILEIAQYAGFSSILVEFVGFGYGLHFNGSSSSGKTTALRVACSQSAKPSTYMHKWNATHNGMEFIGYNSNHAICAIDEVNEAAKTTLDSIYMLVDGMGKARATSRTNGVGQAKVKTWCTVALSSGEVSIEEIAMQYGKNLKAGEAVRMLDIDVGQVCRDKAHADLLIDNSAKYYGTATIAFIEYIQVNKIDVLARFDNAYQHLIKQHAELHGQASRVAKYFALMRVAGDLAIEAGILPSEFKPNYYTTKQFNQWYKDNGNSKEKQQILTALAQAVSDPLRFILNSPDSKVTSHYIGFYDDYNWYLVPNLANQRLWIPKGIKPKLAKALLELDGYITLPVHQPVQYFHNKAQRKLPRLNKSKIDQMADNEE